jgi:anaerobic magnesium-protoporphyrin IX monomethyl ester cyclase
MNILLTHGYFLHEDARERRVMKPYPPLGILYLSAYLKSLGISVQVFDTTFVRMEHFRAFVREHRPDVVGIYTNLMTKLTVLEMIRFLKQTGCIVVLGGPEPAWYVEEFLQRGADVIVIGEGEQTLAHLLEEIELKGVHRLENVDGIAFRNEEGSIIRTNPRELIKDLDSLPLPDREAIDVEQYISTWRRHHGMGSISVITARGCPYTCTWCSHAVYGFTHRRRSPKAVVDEIEHVCSHYKPDMLWIADDVFTINHKWFFEYAREMEQRNIAIPFECISRADRLNDEVLKKMAQLGCFRIWLGSESGSSSILEAMSRGVTPEQICTMTKSAQRHGIQVGLFVMLGYEGETANDIEETIAHVTRTAPDVVLTTVAYPIKGTTYYDVVKDRIATSLPWDQRTERDLTVKGRYSDSFYWFAQRRIMNEVTSVRLSESGKAPIVRRFATFAKAQLARIGMEMTKQWRS